MTQCALSRPLAVSMWCGAMLSLALLCACSIRGGRRQTATPPQTILCPPPTSTTAPSTAPASPAERPAQPNPYLQLLQGDENLRQGNPEEWGEAGSRLVGRTFDPVYFDEGSIDLDAVAKRRLNEHAAWLSQNQRVWITLVGHTDAQSTLEYGYNIGMARALAARNFLIGQGLDPLRIYPSSTGQDMLAFAFEAHENEPQAHQVEVLGFIAPPGYDAPRANASTPDPAPETEEPSATPSGSDIPRL